MDLILLKFRQHDVQELLRKLFEAMEITFKRGNLLDKKATPVNMLYEGTLKDYIKCLESGDEVHERLRYDPYMDLLLSIRDIGSLKEALDKYTEEEILDGDNKWSCEKCDKKVKASKGLKLKSTPLFLTLQLKRFDYDYTTWQRIKLNNKVTFPLEFSIRPWLTEDNESKDTDYELFSVLIHSGGAAGGHYYAMIKNVYDSKWYKFNDASVTPVEPKDIEAMYGEAPGSAVDEAGNKKIVRNQNFSTNAYLLLYRLKGDVPPTQRELPDYIKKMIDEENEKFKKEKEEWLKQRDNLPLDIHFKDLVMKLHIDKNETLKTATEAAYKLANLSEPYTLSCVRLRKYNPQTGTKGRVFASEDYSKKLDELGFIKNTVLIIDLRNPDQEWEKDTGEYKLNVVKVNESTQQLEEPFSLSLPDRSTTLHQFKLLVSEYLSWPSAEIRVVQVSFDANSTILEGEEKELQKDFGYVDGNSIYVERFSNPSAPSIVKSLFDEAQNRIQLYFNRIGERDFDQEIAISKTKTLGDLRLAISKQIDLLPNKFKICKSRLGNEYKDETKTLEAEGLFDGQAIFIQEGEPLLANEVKLKFVLYDRDKDEFSEESTYYNSVGEATLIEDIRKMALEHPLVQGKAHVRLRAKHGKKAGPILYDGKSLKESVDRLVDNQTIAIQLLDEPEFVKPNEILVQLQQWFPSKQELEEKGKDVVLPSKATINTLKNYVSAQQNLPVEFTALAKPYSYQLKNKNTLSTLLNWEIDPDTPLEDGDLILFKDKRDPEVELEGYVTPGNSSALRMEVSKPKEVGITIHTLYDEEGREKFKQLGITKDETESKEEVKTETTKKEGESEKENIV